MTISPADSCGAKWDHKQARSPSKGKFYPTNFTSCHPEKQEDRPTRAEIVSRLSFLASLRPFYEVSEVHTVCRDQSIHCLWRVMAEANGQRMPAIECEQA